MGEQSVGQGAVGDPVGGHHHRLHRHGVVFPLVAGPETRFGRAPHGDTGMMPNPQNPELRRSEESLRPRPELGPDPHDVGGGEGRPVPPDNQPGHSPERDQDKPPPDEFARALGIDPDKGDDQGDGGGPAEGGRTEDVHDLEEAAARHDHHTGPDPALPHDEGMVTPTGAPVTSKVLTVPIQCATTAVKVGTGAARVGGGVLVYGLRTVRRIGGRVGERIGGR